ncbi:hypothetical protein [Rhizobium leguminosarum]|uniref:hypothetical protein n=1 Tax=Rhizobium leguminosarum TaxID=384 RepID=UPI001C9739C1|nr:hypothetical protein [Rhizobium leguminosarum]
MTNNFIGHSAEAPTHALADVSSSLALLVDQAIAATIPEETAKLAVNGDPETLATLGRAIAVQEGYLIEAVVASLAATHPDRLTLEPFRVRLKHSAGAGFRQGRGDWRRAYLLVRPSRSPLILAERCPALRVG